MIAPRVLVTGGAGYIGSALVRALQLTKREVIAVDNLSTGDESRIPEDVKFYHVDCSDVVAMTEIMIHHKIRAVFHCAARTPGVEPYPSKVEYTLANINATQGLINAMTAAKTVLACIHSSSAAVYGQPRRSPIEEGCKRSPISQYGKTKLVSEECLTESKIPTVALRYFNVAGCIPELGHMVDSTNHIIPTAIRAAAEGRTITINGDNWSTYDGTCVRDYIHISDVVHANILALNYIWDHATTILNIGSGIGHSIKDIVKIVGEQTGKPLKIEYGPRRNGDPGVLICSNEKAKELLGWTASLNVEDMVKSMLANKH